MLIWTIFAIITTATAAVILHPLSMIREGSRNGGMDVLVYRDQLSALDRELASGQIGIGEYEDARAETARRLIRASNRGKAPSASGSGSHRWLKLAIVVFLPLASVGLYARLGSPELRSLPLQERLQNPTGDMAILVHKIEKHLELHPNDGKGWDVLAPVYLKIGRVDDADKAYRNALRILGPNVARLDGLSETMMALADGRVTDDVRTLLAQVMLIEPGNPRARFYLALALEQSGRIDEAKLAFAALKRDAPPGAPWLPMVDEHVLGHAADQSLVSAIAPKPSRESIGDMSAGDRQQMIRAMVGSLDARLTENPDDIEGWMRLIRSYGVLNEQDRAQNTFRRGLAAFASNGEQRRRLVDLAHELGLTTEETQR